MHLVPLVVLICVCFDTKGRGRGEFFCEKALKRARFGSLKVVSEGSGASLKGNRKVGRGIGGRVEDGVELIEKRTHSLLREICSDGEARCPERSQTEDCLDGGPGATED